MKTLIIFAIFLGTISTVTAAEFYYMPTVRVEKDTCGCAAGTYPDCKDDLNKMEAQDLNSAIKEFDAICKDSSKLVKNNCECKISNVKNTTKTLVKTQCRTENAILYKKVKENFYESPKHNGKTHMCKELKQ